MNIEKTNKNKLGSENISSLLFSLSIPAIIGQLVSLLYNIVDRIFIGHIPNIGGDALTGIGVTTPLIIIVSAFASLIGMGGAPKAAIEMGKDNNDRAENIIGNSFILLLISSFSLTIFFLLFNKKLLITFGASSKTLPYALEYMNIYTFGTIFVQLTLGLNPFISTQGFSKISMFTILIGAIINIILDPIFIFIFNMNVKGAALATVISQAISAIWVLKFLRGDKTTLKLKKKYFKLKKDIILSILTLGLSPFIMQITESLIFIAFNFSLQKFGGDIAVGAMTILSSAMQFMFLPLSGLTQGAQPIISYNYGANKYKRVEETFKLLFIIAFGYSFLFWLFLMITPKSLVKIFTNDKDIINLATSAMRVYMGGSFMLGIQIACQQTFIALGNAKTSLFLALLRKVFLLIPLIIILPYFITDKVFAIFISESIADIIAALVTMTLFFKQFKITINDMKLKEN